jgi:hypothetical protein
LPVQQRNDGARRSRKGSGWSFHTQNLEDYHLSLASPARRPEPISTSGGGNLIADNVSFWFWRARWRGIGVSPARPRRLVPARARATTVRAVGRACGKIDFHVVERLPDPFDHRR